MIKKPSDMELTLAQGLFDNITRNVSLVAIEHMFKKLERGVGPNSISEGFLKSLRHSVTPRKGHILFVSTSSTVPPKLSNQFSYCLYTSS